MQRVWGPANSLVVHVVQCSYRGEYAHRYLQAGLAPSNLYGQVQPERCSCLCQNQDWMGCTQVELDSEMSEEEFERQLREDTKELTDSPAEEVEDDGMDWNNM